MASYTIKNLTFSYPKQGKKSLDHITTTIHPGEFVVLCGSSGSGKTTLLRQLKPILAPHGQKSGDIYFEEKPIEAMNQREQAQKIGYVLQIPENQIVTDKVWHELAFGLESLGMDTPSIRLRVAEMASFFGIQNWFHKSVNELSGGQKQLLNLASVMVMQPSVLILDEPTSQLDPIAATNFLEVLKKINRELGTTIILTEHRLDEVFAIADKVIVLDQGKLIAEGTPKSIGQFLNQQNHGMFLSMPVPMQIYNQVENKLDVPITVREGRQWLNDYAKENEVKQLIFETDTNVDRNKEVTVQLKDVFFKYEKELPDVIKNTALKAHAGELYAILGGNGMGKTTLLSLISGLTRPYRGSVQIKGKDINVLSGDEKYSHLIGLLPQNPQTLFIKKTVEDNLKYMIKRKEKKSKEAGRKLEDVISLCQLDNLLTQHPYDLSGGEQQRLALAMVLLLEPEILLLDEPTKGMDAAFKQIFASVLKQLLADNVTIIMISHDVDFCAKYADYCALLFDGSIVSEGATRRFFSGNSFYTTAANRISRDLVADAITPNDVIHSCGGEMIEEYQAHFLVEERKALIEKSKSKKDNINENNKVKRKSQKKSMIGFISFIMLIFCIWKGTPIISEMMINQVTNIHNLAFSSAVTGSTGQFSTYTKLLLLFFCSVLGLVYSIYQPKNKIQKDILQLPKDNRKLTTRTKVAAFLIVCMIPLTIFFGIFYLGDRKFYFISMLIILQTMIPFAMVFEDRKPQAREIVIIAVLCALGVAGRAAFFMVPQFKPVAAIIIISGIALGGESGFLVGAMTMFLSNVFYSHGPWTPWQMFAMGIIGLIAGVFYQKGWLRRDRLSLAIFGGLVVFIVYGGVMNPASVIMFQSNLNWKIIKLSYISGVPFDLIHALGTSVFLFMIGEPMLEKLDRIKIKYGLINE